MVSPFLHILLDYNWHNPGVTNNNIIKVIQIMTGAGSEGGMIILKIILAN